MGIEVKEGRCVFCGVVVKHVRAFNCICEECFKKQVVEEDLGGD